MSLFSKNNPSVATNELTYTAKYEYICSLVSEFLNREESLDKGDEDHVYQDGLIKTLFTADYSKIIYDKVQEALRKNLTYVPGSEPHSAALTRLNTLLVGAYSALGTEFMTKLTTNTIDGVVSLLGLDPAAKATKSNSDYKTIAKFFHDFPIAVICVAGSLEYSIRLLRRRRGTQSSYTSRVTDGSLPTGG